MNRDDGPAQFATAFFRFMFFADEGGMFPFGRFVPFAVFSFLSFAFVSRGRPAPFGAGRLEVATLHKLALTRPLDFRSFRRRLMPVAFGVV